MHQHRLGSDWLAVALLKKPWVFMVGGTGRTFSLQIGQLIHWATLGRPHVALH